MGCNPTVDLRAVTCRKAIQQKLRSYRVAGVYFKVAVPEWYSGVNMKGLRSGLVRAKTESTQREATRKST